ncbi:hypothetical protein ACRALDRAFT_211177 [Sodiomyces alcalophilus JCM 7366]|uniref:uncharacterized protein n=1 Tax=Sodiomyces alcalophilus JCM 7366 TaxID=591952 RepID=UPI0039B3AFCB
MIPMADEPLHINSGIQFHSDDIMLVAASRHCTTPHGPNLGAEICGSLAPDISHRIQFYKEREATREVFTRPTPESIAFDSSRVITDQGFTIDCNPFATVKADGQSSVMRLTTSYESERDKEQICYWYYLPIDEV